MYKLLPALLFLFFDVSLSAQETIINLSLSQPRVLIIEAGNDLILGDNDNITLGNDLTIKGGTPAFSYFWSSKLGEIASTPAVTVSSGGAYFLTVTDSRNCSDSDTITVFASSVSLKETNHPWIIYPNPAENKIIIRTEPSNPVISVDVLSVSGEILIIHSEYPSKSSNALFLDISGLHQGIYLLRIKSKEFNSLKSFVKN
jgi:hypothetical protein